MEFHQRLKLWVSLSVSADEQAMLGDFPKAIDEAIMDSSDAHQNQMFQLLGDPKKAKSFARIVFEMLKAAG